MAKAKRTQREARSKRASPPRRHAAPALQPIHYALVAGELAIDLRHFAKRVSDALRWAQMDAEEPPSPDAPARGASLADVTKILWPHGTDHDRAVLAAIEAYVQARRGRNDEQTRLAWSIAIIAWRVVLGTLTAKQAHTAVETTSGHRVQTDVSAVEAAASGRTDAAPLTRAFRLYNALARGLPVFPRADMRGAPRGKLREMLEAAERHAHVTQESSALSH